MSNNINRQPYLLRRSFSVIDTKTKEKYEDIKSAFLLALRINTKDALTGYISETSDKRKVYHLQLNSDVQHELLMNGEANCLVSFQVREIPFSRGKQVNVAFAKLLEEKQEN